MNAEERVVITGIGVVTPEYIGGGVLKEKSERETTKDGDFLLDTLEKYIPYKILRRICRFSQLALLSHLICRDDAQIKTEDESVDIGSVMNTCYGPLNVTEKILNTIIYNGPADVSPMEFSNTVNNCATGQVSIVLKLKGESSTLIGSSAVSYAYDLIHFGKTKAIFVSGLEEENNNLEKLAGKYGVELCENSSCILLESLSHAQARGAHIYAEIKECDVSYLLDESTISSYSDITSFADGRIEKTVDVSDLEKNSTAVEKKNMLGASEVYNIAKTLTLMEKESQKTGVAVSTQPGGCVSRIKLERGDLQNEK